MGPGIVLGILFMAAGAILTFALDATVGGVDLDVVGWILMLVGALGLLLGLMTAARAPRAERRV